MVQAKHMVMIKCFQTENMPKFVYKYLELLSDRDIMTLSKDEMTVVECGEDAPRVYQWFICNGAKEGETVLLERGLWN